ncbi:MAG: hypothetical protein AMXMBFR20_04300 [Planctomycetia bacterium]|nr:DUF309 domain-containing protein [Planctomycetota bacterium]
MNDAELTQFRTTRLSVTAFPPYRFLPGRDPHPTASPQGHSYLPPGTQEPAVEWESAEGWEKCEAYLYGWDLHNHAYWWEAHEAWEGLWHKVSRGSLPHRYLQGLIQVTACHLKLRLGQADGVERLRESSRGYLASVIEEIKDGSYMGIRVDDFTCSLDAYYAKVFRPDEGVVGHDPAIFPYGVPGRSPFAGARRLSDQ